YPMIMEKMADDLSKDSLAKKSIANGAIMENIDTIFIRFFSLSLPPSLLSLHTINKPSELLHNVEVGVVLIEHEFVALGDLRFLRFASRFHTGSHVHDSGSYGTRTDAE
ncbi:hypothetical protein PENTCL1PPCAC_16664, partial [Pristionchus entomophagus]